MSGRPGRIGKLGRMSVVAGNVTRRIRGSDRKRVEVVGYKDWDGDYVEWLVWSNFG